MGGGGACASPAKAWVPPIQNFEKICPHLNLQDTQMFMYWHAPLEKVVHPLVPPENWTLHVQ